MIWFILFIFVSNCSSFILTPSNATTSDDDGKSSLVFVFDTTASMANDLRQLRAGAEMILKTAMEESHIIADFVFVPFHDPSVGPATVTKNKEVFKAALNIVNVYGGGDCPEMSLGGILLALNVSRPGSYIYVFTDATAADYRLVGKVLDAVQKQQSQVVFVLTGHCKDLEKPTYKVYQQIAAASSGQVFNLNKTNVHKVLDFVRNSIKGRAVNLASVVNPPGYNHTQKIPVDSSVNEVTVSVSGAKPQIRVVNPSGKELTGPPQLVTTLDLSEIMVVKVLDPEPGNWSITVGSIKEHSVKVVALSNITFAHGFSVLPPTSMADTTYRPLQGTYNHMLISITSTDAPVKIHYAEILNLEGKTLFEIPLRPLNNHDKLYVADAFVPPNEMFYISVNGIDDTGKDLRRVGATAVQVKPPDAPLLLEVPHRIESSAHERVVLTCKVESMVPVTAGWVKDGREVQPKISSLQSTTVQYVIEDMSESHIGSYECVAHNIAGLSKAKTEVDLIVEPPQVSMLPFNVSIASDSNVTITCSVFSEAAIRKTFLIFNGTNGRTYVTDFNIARNLDGVYTFKKTLENLTESYQGLYTCVAENRGGASNVSIQLTILPKPIAHILGPHTLTRHAHTNVQFVCCVENALEMYWLNPEKKVLDPMKINGTYNAMLDVNDIRKDGVWTCVAVRNNYTASDSIELKVLIKPEAYIEGSKNITVLNGTITQVACLVTAKPAPRILWHMETERFLPNEVTAISPNMYKSILTLDSTKEPVNGTYFCFGENSEGINQDSVTVQVRRKMILLEKPKDVTVDLYSNINITCKVDAYPSPIITWYHNNTLLHSESNKMEDNSTIYIDHVDFNDLGLYTCIADNGFEVIENNVTVTVTDLEIPVLYKKPKKIVTKKGESVILTCRLLKGKPEPIISWQYKLNDSPQFVNVPTNMVIDTDIGISNITIDYGGTYRCVAENVLGKDQYDVELVVQYPPELLNSESIENQSMTLKLGEKIKLNCNVTGNPPPMIIWTMNEQPIAFSRNIYLNEENELIINNATEYESGTFTCDAISPLGSLQKNFTLTVFKTPEILSTTYFEKEVLEGQLVEFPCSTRGIPKPSVQWLQNGQAITERRKYIDEYGIRFVANLTDFGNYSCIASNEYGIDIFNYTLYVWVAPSIEPPLEETLNILESSNVTLVCDVIGFPLPQISWEYNGKILYANNSIISFNDAGNLNITNVSISNEGIYTCVAENIAGVAIKEFNVIVEEPPKIDVENMEEYVGIAGRDLSMTLTCKATGKPRPYILWLKDEFYLDTDSRYEINDAGSLTIKQPTVELSGNYTCIVKNPLGTVNKTMQVHIYPLPARMQSEQLQTSVKLVEGRPGSLQCPVQHADQVKWYKDAELMSNNVLIFSNVSRSIAGAYACVVSNKVGSTHALVSVSVFWPPRFVNQPVYDVQVVKGDDIYLDCEADSKPKARNQWFFNTKLMLGEDRDKLKIMNTREHHTGVYKCIVSNEYGTIQREFNLSVLARPFISDFEVLEVQLKEGTKATLECDAKGFPKPEILWTYNNSDWSLLNSSLIAESISLKSEGIFRCEARNEAGVAHLVYNVTAVSVARIKSIVLFSGGEGTNVEKSLDIALNTNARIACSASGNPLPTIQWFRNGNKISENQRGIGYADLVFDKASISNAGIYTCVAANEGGFNERSIRINILEPPRIFGSLSQNENFKQNSSTNTICLDVLSEQSFFMHCHAYGNPMPEIYWFRDGLPLKFYDDTIVSKEYGEILAVNKATAEHTGNYTCVTRNSVGESSVVYLVDVLVAPPQPKDRTKHIKVRIGHPLNITCPVEGKPLPYVMWFKHPYTEIIPTDRVNLTADNFTLSINNTEVLDSGNYSCVMTNKVGSTEIIFDVIIEKAPSIASNIGDNTSEKHVIGLRRSVVLKCETDGNPTPKISWLKDIQKLSDNLPNIQNLLSTSLLAIWSVGIRDAGQYICVAENEVGTAHRRYNVIVQVPGKWSGWSGWSYCNVTCGLGYQHRTRICQYVDEFNNTYDAKSQTEKIILDETSCKGSLVDKRKCHMPACEEELTSYWSRWSRWSACSATCGAATQTRTRLCKGVGKCSGDNVQVRKCKGLPPCRVSEIQPKLPQNKADVENEFDIDYLPQATFEIPPAEPHQLFPEYDDYVTQPVPKASPYYDVNVTENLDQSEQGPCNPGYWHNIVDNSCIDIDECTLEVNQCHRTQVCANTAGGYRCSCPRGYMSLGAGRRCLDINECAQNTARCEYACVNTAGGYVCACPARLRLHADRHHCVPPSVYNKPLPYDDSASEDYLSTSIDFPSRYYAKRSRT